METRQRPQFDRPAPYRVSGSPCRGRGRTPVCTTFGPASGGLQRLGYERGAAGRLPGRTTAIDQPRASARHMDPGEPTAPPWLRAMTETEFEHRPFADYR